MCPICEKYMQFMVDYDAEELSNLHEEFWELNCKGENFLHYAMMLPDFFKELVPLIPKLKMTEFECYDVVAVAIRLRHESSIKVLINAGVNCNAKDSQGNTLLNLCIMTKPPPEIIKMILDGGADINAKQSSDLAILDLAVMNDCSIETIKILIKAGAYILSQMPESDILTRAICNNNSKTIRVLAEAGVSINGCCEIIYTPLTLAATIGSGEVIKCLLELGANIDALNGRGSTALMECVWFDKIDCVRILIEAGANVNVKNRFDNPLIASAQCGYLEIMTLLLDKNADPNVKNSEGRTPLMYASFNGHLDIVKELLKRGADPSLKDYNDRNAKFFARKTKNTEIIKILDVAVKMKKL